jgi:hypothetical protein
MRIFVLRLLLAAVLFFDLAHGAHAANCPDGGWYCSKLYLFEAPAFNMLDAELNSSSSPNPKDAQWITYSWAANILNNRDVYIGTGDAAAPGVVTNILQPLRQLWWRGQMTVEYSSYAAFAADVATGNINPAATAVSYTISNSSSVTPADEQQNPVYYARLFSDLAHQQGLTAIVDPSCGLLNVIWPTVYPPYNSVLLPDCANELLVGMALTADIIVFDVQGDEGNSALYGQTVSQAAAVVKLTNPYIKFVGKISTDNTEMTSANATVADVIASAKSAFNYVDGFSINMGNTSATVNDAFTAFAGFSQH